jgi:hypothetical protein
MLRKRAFGIAIAMVFASSLMAQNNVQITISLINPLTNQYQMTVQNNNSGWWVDQLHVLYTTAGVLQATSTPANWAHLPDVPWDAIPHNLRFQANTPAARIAPGASQTFGYKMNTPTPVEDWYIQFRVSNATNTTTKEYAFRVKVVQTLDTPKDALGAVAGRFAYPGGSPGSLEYEYEYATPTTQYLLRVSDGRSTERDSVFYPEIPDPPHLEHYFTGVVSRSIDASGASAGDLWAFDSQHAHWCGGGSGFQSLNWQIGGSLTPVLPLSWRFAPSVYQDDGSRRVQLTVENRGNQELVGDLYLYTQGARRLTGRQLADWRRIFQPDIQQRISLQPRQSIDIAFTVPPNAPPTRYFYAEFVSGANRLAWAQQEINSPILIGYLAPHGANRPVTVQITNPNTGTGITKTTTADANGVWRILLEPSDDALQGDAGFYTPVWLVQVKAQGALSQQFPETLLPGGDTIDPYLRSQLVLGDVNGDDCIDDADLLAVLFAFGGGDPNADLNGDGIVDDADLLLVLFNFGAGC